MSDVTRYHGYVPHLDPKMFANPDNEWVRWKDVESLFNQETKAANKRIKELEKLLRQALRIGKQRAAWTSDEEIVWDKRAREALPKKRK